MLFSSIEFVFLFLPLVFFVYFLLANEKKTRPAKYWLIAASMFFYAWWEPKYTLLLLFSITFNFFIGKKIQNKRFFEKKTQAKRYLTFGVLLNIAILAYYKYADFVLYNATSLLHISYTPIQTTLPLAISFFTFLQIAYIVDCYKDFDKIYSYLDYTLFVTFFPHLIAGPLIHHEEMMPQFENKKNWKIIPKNCAMGLFIFSIGLFKKMGIADPLSVLAKAGFDGHSSLSFIEAWATSLSYTFQLYFDFSGYSDMAIGVSLMFNILLPVNFNSPYKASNIQEFWRRWHITLSRWLQQYVYVPLGGNRNGTARTCANLFLTFLIGGIWHGAGWTFVIWGILHGLALITHRLWKKLFTPYRLPGPMTWFITFLFINFAWVFFRATSLKRAGEIILAMAGRNGLAPQAWSFGLSAPQWGCSYAILLIAMTIAWATPNSMQLVGLINNFPQRRKLSFSATPFYAILTGIFLGIGCSLLFASPATDFIYFNF